MTEHDLQPLRREIHECREEVKQLSSDVRDLIEAWQTARGLVKFVKLIGSIATAFAALWALWRFSK